MGRHSDTAPGRWNVSTGGGAKAILAAFLANLGIAVAKFVGFVVTGSSSMLAESVHSLADTGNQGLLMLGGRRARRQPDPTHPFGYGRERFFWAFVVALVLFSMGSLFALYEGVEKVRHPHRLESPVVAIVILVVAIGLEGSSLRTALSEIRGGGPLPPLWRYVRTTKNPELPAVLLEDTAAITGLVAALAATVLAWKVDPVWDGVGTLVIAALLAVIAAVLAVEMKSLLIGEAASPADLQAIRDAVASADTVDRLIHLRTEHIGPEAILLAVKIAFHPELSIAQLSAAIDDVEARVRAAVPAVGLIYVEPDLFRGETPDEPGADGHDLAEPQQ
jgi:cation diffusion facilitator family transporter